MDFLWPPRPEKAIPPSMIAQYDDKGWITQLKKNGTCSVATVSGKVSMFTRHGTPHKMWEPTQEIVSFFSEHQRSVFVFELLHNKHPSVKNTIYLFDVLVYKGDDLTGSTYMDRYSILQDVVPRKHKRIWLAENHHNGDDLFHSLDNPIDEGIVLKDPNGRLRTCLRDGKNSGWQFKCRKLHANYSF